MKRTIWELEAIKANTILDPRIEVPWVEPHHFMPQGKFAHIYIPRYVYIPKDVFNKSSIQLELDTTSYTAFWRQLREAQGEAQQMINNMIDHEQLRSLYKTDHRKMLKGQLPKTIRSSRLEIIQHKHAHIEAQRIGWKRMTPRDIYDWFIRPIEKLFAIDMPRGATLLRAMLYPQSAKHLLTFIKRYTGIPKGAKINAIYVIEEMSRIRMANEIDFNYSKYSDTPMARMQKIRLEEDPTGSCYVKTSHEGNTQQSPESETEYEDADLKEFEQSTYEDQLATWDNIMAEYDTAMSVPMQYGPKQKRWITQLIRKTHDEAKKVLQKCRDHYQKLQQRNRQQPKEHQTFTTVHKNGSPLQRNESPTPSSTTSESTDDTEMGEETNLANMFQKKLYICNRTVSDILDNSRLIHTAEERAAFRDIRFYENAVEEAKLDLLKCDPSDTDFIDALTRAQDNCSMAYQRAREKLQHLLIEGDEREARRRSTATNVQATRHKTVKHARKSNSSMTNKSMTTTSSPQEDKNNIFEPRPSGQTHKPSTSNWSNKPRPTAWPTAQQIRSQNPYKPVSKERSPTRGKRIQPPWHTEPMDELESPRLGKNPKFNPNYSHENARRSPTKTQTRITHDHMFEDMDTPSSESFRANATITSTPKAHRREWKTERFPSPNMIRRSDYPQHREEERRTTRQRSPSPPQPGNCKTQREFKPARRKAPNGENLFHYKLWKQLDISRPPRFTSQQLSAQEVARYITGTVTNDDTTRPGLTTIMADSNDTSRKIQFKIEIEERHLKLTEYTYPQNKTFGTKFTMQTIQIPEHALEKFGQFLNEIHNAQLQSLDQDYNTSGHLLMIRTKHDDWKAKATITLVKTTSGMERMVTIISRSNQFEHGVIQIPWMLFHKFHQAYLRIEEDYKHYARKRDAH